eukprot:gnl/TRDRNA2_/TRDRNA2_80094_c0_seq1.p1 gnl/TRDRNA2_/TRDRNA2_80094_c0~~gnl/TRDRNA2_/TRDRNA2_80094_c0_seq1.p1  ORF type:complete len:241 (+),score=73.45 gnl/TRDRNA2_/TRDRNA2_80094_c0_seq1:103-825(+)
MEAALQGAVAEEEEASAAPEPSMDASWELLRLAIKERDFKLVTTTLCRELECSNHLDLLPFVRGVLTEVVKHEDEVFVKGKARRAKRSSGFDRFNKENLDAEAKQQEDTCEQEALEREGPRRRWRRAVRAIFDVEAALALQQELIDIYQTPEFGREYCKPLDDSWGYNTDRQAMLDAIRGVTNQVMLPVITGYGFTADRKGSNEAEATILALSKEYKEVAVKGTEMQRIILNQFPRMKRS